MRRLTEPNFLNRYFAGNGIDIGGAPDPLWLSAELFPLMGDVRVWDLADGDAQVMAGVPDGHYDFVHSSHCLEHLRDPKDGLRNWFRILKPGGFLVVTVPDEDLYEQGQFPSTYNRDHKWTFTVHKASSWSDRSLNVLDLVTALGPAADVHKVALLDATYRYDLPRVDQTKTAIGESAIEFVIRKRTLEDIDAGGRLPAPGRIPDKTLQLLAGSKRSIRNIR